MRTLPCTKINHFLHLLRHKCRKSLTILTADNCMLVQGCDSTRTDFYFVGVNLLFLPVSKTVQCSAPHCSCGSCYTEITVQGGVLQQPLLLAILTHLVSENPFECEVKQRPVGVTKKSCCLKLFYPSLNLSCNL